MRREHSAGDVDWYVGSVLLLTSASWAARDHVNRSSPHSGELLATANFMEITCRVPPALAAAYPIGLE